MRNLVVAGCSAGVLLIYTPFLPVASAAPDPRGKLCTFIPGGGMEGGPLVLGDDTDPTAVYSGSMTCTVQSGPNNLYAEADYDSTTSLTTTGTTAAVGGTVSAPATRPLYICTSVTITGFGTLNYDYPSENWVAAPGGECDLPYEPFGLPCEFTSTDDPTGAEDTQAGFIGGGPLVVTDEPHVRPPLASLTCIIRIGAQSFTLTGPTTPGVVVVAPTPVSFEAPAGEIIHVCSQVDFEDGGTLYWCGGGWFTSPPAN